MYINEVKSGISTALCQLNSKPNFKNSEPNPSLVIKNSKDFKLEKESI